MEWGIVCPVSPTPHLVPALWSGFSVSHSQIGSVPKKNNLIGLTEMLQQLMISKPTLRSYFARNKRLKIWPLQLVFFSFVCSCRKLCLICMNVIQHEIRYNCFLYFKSMYYINYVGWDDFLLGRVPPPVLKIFSKFSCLYFGFARNDNLPKHQTKM